MKWTAPVMLRDIEIPIARPAAATIRNATATA